MRLSSQEVRGLNGCRTRRDRYDASRRRDERRELRGDDARFRSVSTAGKGLECVRVTCVPCGMTASDWWSV